MAGRLQLHPLAAAVLAQAQDAEGLVHHRMLHPVLPGIFAELPVDRGGPQQPQLFCAQGRAPGRIDPGMRLVQQAREHADQHLGDLMGLLLHELLDQPLIERPDRDLVLGLPGQHDPRAWPVHQRRKHLQSIGPGHRVIDHAHPREHQALGAGGPVVQQQRDERLAVPVPVQHGQLPGHVCLPAGRFTGHALEETGRPGKQLHMPLGWQDHADQFKIVDRVIEEHDATGAVKEGQVRMHGVSQAGRSPLSRGRSIMKTAPRPDSE